MKALAASSIGQYEKSVQALSDYYRAVELGLNICLREMGVATWNAKHWSLRSKKADPAGVMGAVVFGSDQGLVGQFNESIVDFALQTLSQVSQVPPKVWAVGERVEARLSEAGLNVVRQFSVPNSVRAIAPLVGQLLLESETHHGQGEISALYLIYHRSSADSADL